MLTLDSSAILEFRDDTADSIVLPTYVVGRCGDRGSGHSSNINTKKTKFSKILSKTVVLRPKRTKKPNFQNFVQNSGFVAKTHKKQNFQFFYPNQIKTDKRNQFFRNLAQNRSKWTKRQNFQKSCFEKVNAPKNIFFRFCVQNSACAVKTHKQNQIFRNHGQNSGFAVKACKTNKIFGIKAPNCPKQRFML